MNNERLEELAALHALGFLDESEEREVRAANAKLLVGEFDETAARLALDAPSITPPPSLKQDIMRQLPTQGVPANIISFSHWIPYAIAACLMLLGIGQAVQIVNLKSQMQKDESTLVAENSRLRESNALKDLRLAELQEGTAAQSDPSYASSHVLVAWDPVQHRGMVSMQALPAPPAGH